MALEGLVLKDLLGEGMLGLMGVNCKSSSRSLMLFLESWEVLNVVLMVWTCHSVKPLDLGKGGKRLHGQCDDAAGIE